METDDTGGCGDCTSREYMCNICYLSPEEPVVTQCGHLFCWGCIYTWLQSTRGCRFCPTCRARMGIDDVIPVLAADSRKENTACPPRPSGNRKPVKVILSGMKVNGTRFGNCVLQEDEIDVFSCRTALGLFAFVCIVVAVTLKSYFFGE